MTHSLSGPAVSYLVNSLWEPAVIFLAVWLVSWILRRLGPRTEHVLWVFALFASVIAPAVPAFPGAWAAMGHSSTANLHLTILAAEDPGNLQAHPGVFHLPGIWFLFLSASYLACVLFFTLRLLLSLHAVRRLLQQARPVALVADQDEIWRRCQKAFSLSHARMLTSARVPGPVALAFPKPVLLMPADFPQHCTPQDFLAAVAHESAHLKRCDFQKNLICEMASLALSFHPLIWVIKSRIAQTREMICDLMATETAVDAHAYSRSLLRLAAMVAVSQQSFTRYAIGIFDGGILERRIMQIGIRRQPVRTLVKYAMVIPSALLLLATVAGNAAMAVVVEPQHSAQVTDKASTYGHLYKVGNGVSAPVPLNSVAAEFPKSGHYGKGFHAIVIVGLVVDRTGMPRDPHVTRSYNKDFDAQAIKAVKHYRFRPATRAGKPVPVAINVEINFKMY